MAELIILGTPLNEEEPLGAPAQEALKRARLIVGESRKPLFRYIRPILPHGTEPPVYLLDSIRDDDWKSLEEALKKMASTEECAVLLSDTGMPILFDPGKEVLELAKRLKFKVRSVPASTSWGTACALSGFEPPFLVQGFLSRKTEERVAELKRLSTTHAHLVLMDTPYRFRALLDQAKEAFGGARDAFLAWEISNPGERLCWGSLDSLSQTSQKEALEKGEFVLIIGKPSK